MELWLERPCKTQEVFRKHDGARPQKDARKFCFYSGTLLWVFCVELMNPTCIPRNGYKLHPRGGAWIGPQLCSNTGRETDPIQASGPRKPRPRAPPGPASHRHAAPGRAAYGVWAVTGLVLGVACVSSSW